ncbi:MAG: hypothetical protein M1825_004241 [Sarcosagium campestre]|nr:MAG: hypothetical protein M1825_004241 [Sarcosagium campestre]
MSGPQLFCPYKETRVNTEPASLTSTITIRLPSRSGPAHLARSSQRKRLAADSLVAEDETTFANRHLATSASIFFRQNKTYPRSFLWRVIEDGRVLTVQPCDLCRPPGTSHEAALTLRFVFPTSIRPSGVAFSDSDSHSPFNIFVLTVSNELYTLNLRPEFFQRSSTTDGDVSEWCKIFLPSSFSFRFPHRIAARHPQDLLVSLHDGGLLRLARASTDNGSSWTETFFNEGGWGGSFRTLIPWQRSHTIRYGNVNLETATATSIAFSPASSLEDKHHMLTVGLDHTLTCWNLNTGKIDYRSDLLDVSHHTQESRKHFIDPSQTALVDVVNQSLRGGKDRYYVVTFSPLGPGQFKFWAVSDGDSDGTIDVEDLHPDENLEPPLPSSEILEIWTMTQFKLMPTDAPGTMTLWVLWKNNTQYRLQSLRFDLLDISATWQTEWVTTATETLRDEPFPELANDGALDPTDKWLEYLFSPGRFSEAAIEASLSIYNQNINGQRDQNTRPATCLQDSVCSAVASSVTLTRSVEGDLEFERFRTDTNFQWRRFFRIVADLERKRGEALSLGFDTFTDMPWVVSADGCIVIRNCDDTEMIWHNDWVADRASSAVLSHHKAHFLKAHRLPEVAKMAALVRVASSFRDNFSEALIHSCTMVMRSEILQEPSQSVQARIRSFYDRSNFAGQVSDDDYDLLVGSMAELGGTKGLTTQLFTNVIGSISQRKQRTKTDVTLTIFGELTLVKGAQEIIHLNGQILFNLLVFLVFLWVEELERKSPAGLAVPEIYVDILRLLKEFEVLNWMAKTRRLEIPAQPVDELETSVTRKKSPHKENRMSTVLQYPWIRMWKPLWLKRYRTMSSMLTESIKHVIADIGLSNPTDYDQQVMWQQRTLLRRGDLNLAAEFIAYQPNTAWAQYIKGRYYLLTGDFAVAVIHFKKAAFNLDAKANREGASSFALNEQDDLLRSTDHEYFNAGLPAYYNHVAELFETGKAFTYVADAATLGLQFMLGSPGDSETQRMRTSLLSRLFSSSVETCSFDRAYSALLRYSDRALQHKDLDKLLTRMCNVNAIPQLLSLPLLSLQIEAEALLEAKSKTAFNLIAGPPYHKILYAWRVKRHDMKGAATVLHERLQRLRSVALSGRGASQTAELMQEYLLLINALATMGPDEAWILAEERKSVDDSTVFGTAKPLFGKSSSRPTRKLVTIADVRKEYQAELDRMACIESDRFAFSGGGGGGAEGDADAMDIM